MKLALINADSLKPPIVLSEFPVILGLSPDSDVCLDDSAIGHYQCMIDYSEGALMVWDLGTTLGTSINGVRVSKTARLRSGDELIVGRSHFFVDFGDGQAKASHRAELPVAEGRPKHRSSTGHRREPAVPA
jgi:predicted component of type VI protein secretion system